MYTKKKKNIYIYDSLEDFVSEVLTNDEHGIFFILSIPEFVYEESKLI